MERVKGIEPSYAAWEAAVLPLNYTRVSSAAGRCNTASDRELLPPSAMGATRVLEFKLLKTKA